MVRPIVKRDVNVDERIPCNDASFKGFHHTFFNCVEIFSWYRTTNYLCIERMTASRL